MTIENDLAAFEAESIAIRDAGMAILDTDRCSAHLQEAQRLEPLVVGDPALRARLGAAIEEMQKIFAPRKNAGR